jgi:hypothetical protein
MAAIDDNGKPTVQHIDAISSVESSEQHGQVHQVKDANEEIVEHLQNTGEEVGMTWRSIMAAIVNSPSPDHFRRS